MKWIKSIKCKLTIALRIFYMWFSFWRKLFWKRFEDNNTCSIFLNFVCAFFREWSIPIYFVIVPGKYILLLYKKCSYVTRGPWSYNPVEAISLNIFAVGQNIELLAAWVHLPTYLLFVVNLSAFKFFKNVSNFSSQKKSKNGKRMNSDLPNTHTHTKFDVASTSK